MNGPGEENKKAFRSAVTITVAGVAIITFAVIFLALFAGIWVDRMLGTKPIFTVGLVIISIPITILLMLRLVKIATNRLTSSQGHPSTKDSNRGTDNS